jgi:hypothetical protein
VSGLDFRVALDEPNVVEAFDASDLTALAVFTTLPEAATKTLSKVHARCRGGSASSRFRPHSLSLGTHNLLRARVELRPPH